MCFSRIRRWLVAAAVLAVGVLIASDVVAQGMGGMGGGGMPDPGAMFKGKKPKEFVGLSLAASDQPVLAVKIEGNKLIPTSQILNEMQTRAGRPYDPALVQRDVRKLTGRSWFMAVDTDIDKQAGRLHCHDQSRRATDDPLHRVPRQRRRLLGHGRHPRQDLG